MLLSVLFAYFTFAQDPRLGIKSVAECVEIAKNHLTSFDYSGEHETALISACREADPLCVREVGDSFKPFDSSGKREGFFKLIRLCSGRGMGKCFAAVKANVTTYDRREAAQIEALLKKCE